MPRIKPVSDLRNYNAVLENVSDNNPVFLTKNGRGTFAIITINEYEKLNASINLLKELSLGEQSAKQNSWLETNDVRKILGV